MHSSLCADSEASPRLSHLDTPKTLIKNQSDGDSTQESSQSASLDHPSPPLFSFGNCPFKRHADLPEALSTLVYKSPLTTRTFYNEKNIPIYNGVYYGLSNSFKQYVFEGGSLLKAGKKACRFLSLNALYDGVTLLWHTPLNTPHMSWTFLPRENALFSSFVTQPLDMAVTHLTTSCNKTFDLFVNEGEHMVDRLSPHICGALFSSSTPFFLYKSDMVEVSGPTSNDTLILHGHKFNQWLKKTPRYFTPNKTSLCVVRGEKRHFFPLYTPASLSASGLPSTSLSCHEDDTISDDSSNDAQSSTESGHILHEETHALYPTLNADFHAYFQNHEKIKTLSLFNVSDLIIYKNIQYTLSISPNHSRVFSGQQVSNMGARLCAQLCLQAIDENEKSVFKMNKKTGQATWIFIPKSNPLFNTFMPNSFLTNKSLCGGIYAKGAFFDILPDDTLTLSRLGRQYTDVIQGADLNKRLSSFFDRGIQQSLGLSSIKRRGHTLYQWNAKKS